MGAAPLKASALLKTRTPSFAAYDEFSFEPPRDPKANNQQSGESQEAEREDNAPRRQADRRQGAADDRQERRRDLHAEKICRRPCGPSQIDAEVTFNDPNGETQTVGDDRRPLAERGGARRQDRLVGQQPRQRPSSRSSRSTPAASRSKVRAWPSRAASAPRSPPASGWSAASMPTTTGSRSRISAASCTGTSDAHGIVECEAAFDTAGQVELIAEAKDGQGKPGPGRRQHLDHQAGRDLVRAGQPTTASTCSPKRSVTKPVRRLASRCACRTARRRRW